MLVKNMKLHAPENKNEKIIYNCIAYVKLFYFTSLHIASTLLSLKENNISIVSAHKKLKVTKITSIFTLSFIRSSSIENPTFIGLFIPLIKKQKFWIEF